MQVSSLPKNPDPETMETPLILLSWHPVSRPQNRWQLDTPKPSQGFLGFIICSTLRIPKDPPMEGWKNLIFCTGGSGSSNQPILRGQDSSYRRISSNINRWTQGSIRSSSMCSSSSSSSWPGQKWPTIYLAIYIGIVISQYEDPYKRNVILPGSINIATKNRPSKKENSSSNHLFSGTMLNFGEVLHLFWANCKL